MNKNKLFCLGFAIGIVISFQNCSKGPGFSQKVLNSADAAGQAQYPSTDNINPNGSTPPVATVCNPLNPSESCSAMPPGASSPSAPNRMGLKGKLYYLTPETHNSIFDNDLNNAWIDDYRQYGILVPVDILMTSINITARSWDSGFILPTGEQVNTAGGDKLFEWFHLDLGGYIQLPEGDYQFSTISDDGIRISINNDVIIDDQGTHAPQYKCSRGTFHFAAGEKKRLRVEYYQGPRYQIAMQFLVRPASKSNFSCSSSGGFSTISSQAYSY